MKNNTKSVEKKDVVFLTVGIGLLLLNLLIITLKSINGAYTLQFPWNSTMALICYLITIIFGIIGITLLRKKEIDIAKIYLIFAIPIGIMFCLANPLGRTPDEGNHARRSMAMSNGNFFSYVSEDGKAEDYFEARQSRVVSGSISSYKDAYDRIVEPDSREKEKREYTTMALYAPICHLPQTIGIWIAKLFGGDVVLQCYNARIMNMLISVLLMYAALKLLPFKKHVLFCIAMLPMTFNEIGSMSSDALTIAMSMLYISYILYLRYDKNVEKITKKNIIVLIITSIVVSLCKIVYIPLCLFLFMIPKEKFESRKQKTIVVSLIFACAIVLNIIWLIYASRFLIEFNPGVDSKGQVAYILTHPISYIFIILRTIINDFQGYIIGICGIGLSMVSASASDIYVYTFAMILTLMVFVNEEDEVKVDLTSRIYSIIIFVMITALIYTSLYVQWNSLKHPVIVGVQARYFIPILFLTTMIADNRKLLYKPALNKRYVLLFMLFFNLNALTGIISSYFNF